MKMKKFNYMLVAVVLTLISFVSCNDIWDSHYYNNTIQNKSSLNLYAYMKTQPELSTFCQMIKIAGFDSILTKPQTYTVWAPVNTALQNINLADTLTVTELVKNHISRFSYPTSGITSKTIYMLDKKFVSFKRTDSGFVFGGKSLIQAKSNVAAANGILHFIDGYVPYLTNIWEFIGTAPGLDSLRAYLYAQSVYQFDPKASVEIGTNAHGQSIYDSIITFSNPVLSKIGYLHVEDSVYTALLPDNKAWTQAYNLIKSNYKTLGAGGAITQRLNTQWAIVKNLVFRNQITNTANLDSLTSTTGSVFHQPSYLFDGTSQSQLSNGIVYVTDSLRFKAEDSYQQKIQVEAENSDYGRSSLYANLYVRSSLGSSFENQVSQKKYLVVEPTTVSSVQQNYAAFPIPNTLSGKYRVYCVFVPSSIVSSTDARQYKVKFYFSYLNAAGKQITDGAISATNSIVTTPGAIPAIFTTNASQITKMFVTEITFPYCNLYDDNATSASITTRLRVENASKITETVKFDRTLRIDYIILEPVP